MVVEVHHVLAVVQAAVVVDVVLGALPQVLAVRHVEVDVRVHVPVHVIQYVDRIHVATAVPHHKAVALQTRQHIVAVALNVPAHVRAVVYQTV